ncbi:ATP-binding protein [Rhodovulum marinum]|uniref:Transcriptional regulator n=1 Tax=Rhodovulum marinum TaxID=320662 RepID=A0A4R2Q4R7_9RHOB|nr:AAA family ATPase [Rhodovulum marinum]TCP42894.1 transcriptional regulator [Rhodovulum marinum]
MAYRFLTFELDTGRRELLARGHPVALPPKAFDLLAYLVTHHDRMVPKAELMDRFWPANTTEAALQKAISQVRKALGTADPGGGAALRTYHGRGIRFAAPVTDTAPPPAALPPPGDPRPDALPLDERHPATVLCVTLETGAGPAAAVETLLARARDMVERHQGRLLRMMLDGFTAAFGLDPLYEDGARRAVHCAAALAALDTVPDGVDWRFGLDSGALRPADRGAWALPGEIERGAIALAEAAQPRHVLLSAAVRDQLRGEADTAPARTGFRLVSVAPMRAGIPARPRARPPRFVGRTAEMTFLAAQRDMLLAGHGQAVVLCGPAGIGKTRLVAEFLAGLDGAALRIETVHCLPALSNTPLAPIRALCRALCALPPAGTVTDAVDAALLQDLLGAAPPESPALQTLSDHQRRQRGRALVDRILTTHGADRPLVIVFEDVHWLDATSRDYLDHLLAGIDGKRLMVVLTTRPTEAPPPAETVLNLSSLGRAESLALLRETCPEADLAAEAAQILVDRAQGNPFFIEELALAARAGGDPAVDLPGTVQAVIAVRIGALDPWLRRLVYVIAVIGPPAPPALVAHLLGQDPARIAPGIADLVRRGFVHDGPAGLGFRHILIADAAYAMVAPADRTRLHGRIAAHQETAGTDPPPDPERLAWHHQEAGARDRAIPCWIAASRAALHRSARTEAVAFAESGLALIDPDTPDDARHELDLLLCLAPALTALRGFGSQDVGRTYARADRLNRRVGTVRSEIRVRVGLWIHTWVRGRLAQSLRHADRLLALADRIGDPALTLQAHASRGQVLMHRGTLATALNHLATGLAAIETAPPATMPAQNAATSCAAYASWVARMMGRQAQAAAFLDRSRALAELQENPFAAAIHFALCSESYMVADDVPACLDYADRAVALSRDHDFAFWLGTGLVMRGWALGRQGAHHAAFAAYDEGIAVFEATDARVQLANWHGLRAETLLAAGRDRAALGAAQHALTCARRAEDVYFTPRIHAVAARAQARLGHPDRAADHDRQAAALARRFGMGAHVLNLALPN